MTYSFRRASHRRSALFAALIALPFLIALIDLKDQPISGAPSALSLALLFIHMLSLPTLSWLYAYRYERGFTLPNELMLARFGRNRAQLVLRSLTNEWLLTFMLGYGLSALCVALNYNELNAQATSELRLILPVTLVWTATLTFTFHMVRAWAHQIGLWLMALLYALTLSVTVPLGPVSQLERTLGITNFSYLVSPLYHLAHLLGALQEQVPCPGWVSFIAIGAYGAAALSLFLLKIPR